MPVKRWSPTSWTTAAPAMKGYACALAAFVFALMLLMNKLVNLVIRRVGH